MVPGPLQRAVYETYRVGQCDDKAPSAEWCRAADAAVQWVANLEGRTVRLTFMTAFHPEIVVEPDPCGPQASLNP